MPTSYTVTVENYTNKKNQTKAWLFIREVGQNSDWTKTMLKPGQCEALIANLATVRQFAGTNNTVNATPQPAVIAPPAPAPVAPVVALPPPAPEIETTPSVDVPAPLTPQQRIDKVRAAKGKQPAAAKLAAPPEPKPTATAAAAPLKTTSNPKINALIARALGKKFASVA